MKSILVPTDFSANADNAIMYALEMNKKFNAKISLFHSYFIPVYAAEVPMNVPSLVELKNDAMKALEKVREKINMSFPGNKFMIETSVAEGIPDDEISAVAEKKKPDLLIMGTKGARGLREVLIGTTTASVMKNINCPIIAVPSEAKFREIKKIVFATNYAENDFENIESVIDFAKHYNAEVIILHIFTGHLSKSFEYNSIERFEQRIKEDSGYDRLNFKLFENKDVEEGVSIYLDESNADLIAMTNRHRSFFQKLFDQSITKKMVNHTHIPLMAFHVKERGNYLI